MSSFSQMVIANKGTGCTRYLERLEFLFFQLTIVNPFLSSKDYREGVRDIRFGLLRYYLDERNLNSKFL